MAHVTPLFKNGKATTPLLKLIELTTGVINHSDDIKSILEMVQKVWRQPTQHSGDIKDIFASHVKTEARPLFEELGFIGEQTDVPYKDFDFCYLSGAYILAVRKRFALVKRMWEQGKVQFPHIVLAGGKRARHPVKESLEILNKADGGLTLRNDWQVLVLGQEPRTEDLIMEMVLLQSELPSVWASGWKKGTYTVVGTPLRTDRPEKPDPSGEDVLQHWLKTAGPVANSRVLLVYSQPQLRHMEVVAQRIFERHEIKVTCVGYEAPGEINVSQVLDTIAKVIYELAKSYWRVRVKTNHDGISMTSGALIVTALTQELAAEEIRKTVSQWTGDDYVPAHAPIKGPFSTYKEACGD